MRLCNKCNNNVRILFNIVDHDRNRSNVSNVGTNARTHVGTNARTHVRTNARAHVGTNARTDVRTNVGTYARTYVRYVRTRTNARKLCLNG